MGWSTGSSLMSDIVNTMKRRIRDKDQRKKIYKILIVEFENYDCDGGWEDSEAADSVFTEALKELYPDYYE